MKGKNYGVGCPGGVEVVSHSLRDVLKRHAGSDLALLKIDFQNAFNQVDRNAFVKSTCSTLPGLSNWTEWCYSRPSVLLYAHEHILWSSAGVQQGDPLGPLYFCFGLAPLVSVIQSLGPVYNKWYMDDGGIVASVETLKRAWAILESEGPPLGLVLSKKKCEWSWLDPKRTEACPIPGVSLVPTDEICMLGVPLGSAAKSAEFVQKKLFSRLSTAVERLQEFEDSQSAFFLLRVSFSIVRAVHFMRTTPLVHWSEQAEQFDSLIRRATEQILGFTLDEAAYVQACLTPSLGGLGLRRTTVHADAAFQASWREAKSESGENWILPDFKDSFHGSQKQASYRIDEEIHKKLVARAESPRERQRLLRLTEPHAGAWVTAVPSNEDGFDTVMAPKVFRVAVAYRLGVQVVPLGISCPRCMQTIDVLGDHASCCEERGSHRETPPHSEPSWEVL